MAIKGRKDGLESNGKGKGGIRFRYMDSERLVDFSVDNDDASVTDGLRLIANALAGRNISVAPTPKLLKKTTGGSTEVLEKDEEEILEQPLPFPPAEPVDEHEEVEEETESAETTAKAKRKVKRPNVLDDPKLTGAKVSLVDFMAQRGNPAEMMDKYSVVAVWYKLEFNITDIDIHRVYTAFKHAGWDSQLPTDVEKPLKNLTYQRSGLRSLKLLAPTRLTGWAKTPSTRWALRSSREYGG
jgi:hypothetical protein